MGRKMVIGLVVSLTLAGVTHARSFALCVLKAEFECDHPEYGEYKGHAWADVVFLRRTDPVPEMGDLEKAFSDTVRAGSWLDWNPRYKNEDVKCTIHNSPARGQGRKSFLTIKENLISDDWKVRGVGALYWWNNKEKKRYPLIINNSDWKESSKSGDYECQE